jgi:hypothetical protein
VVCHPDTWCGQAVPHPYQAMMALDVLKTEGDIWTEDDGNRIHVGHRIAAGQWTY